MRRAVHLAVVLALLVATPALAATPRRWSPPRIGHVFVIVLENKTYDETFGPDSKAPYLSRELTSRGVLFENYYGIGHFSLDNYIAMISGQGPNLATQADCPIFADFRSPNGGALDADGQAIGQGCVYPSTVRTVADQLHAARLTWHGYMEDMGNSPTAAPTCRHPAVDSRDDTQSARVGDQYATRHNPFVYFHSIIDTPECDRSVVPLDRLVDDLRRVATTPNFSFITPNLCHDGHDAPCVDGAPGGLVSADAFLRTWVPRITTSPAYRRDGMLIVTFDESEAAGPRQDSAACCGERQGPNTPMAGQTGPGGGRMGTVVLSRFVHPGSRTSVAYNHYSLLRSVEDVFALTHLGYAARPEVIPFGPDVYRRD